MEKFLFKVLSKKTPLKTTKLNSRFEKKISLWLEVKMPRNFLTIFLKKIFEANDSITKKFFSSSRIARLCLTFPRKKTLSENSFNPRRRTKILKQQKHQLRLCQKFSCVS